MTGTTRDGFLGGRLTLTQPAKGFRAGVDSVLLAAAVPARSGQSVLELGIGPGVASACLAARVSGLAMSGLELQPDYGALSEENLRAAGAELDLHIGDVREMPKALKARAFDHVFANPPYYRPGAWTRADGNDRSTALEDAASMTDWVDAATRRLRPGGTLTVIQKAARLTDLLGALDTRLGSVEIKPISPRQGRAAELVIIRARKEGRADPILHAPLILHAKPTHEQDGADLTEAAEALLRHGQALEF